MTLIDVQTAEKMHAAAVALRDDAMPMLLSAVSSFGQNQMPWLRA